MGDEDGVHGARLAHALGRELGLVDHAAVLGGVPLPVRGLDGGVLALLLDALVHLQALAGATLALALGRARMLPVSAHPALHLLGGTVLRLVLGSFAAPGRPTAMSLWFSIARGEVGRRAGVGRARECPAGRQPR